MAKVPPPVTEADWKLYEKGEWPPKAVKKTPAKPKPAKPTPSAPRPRPATPKGTAEDTVAAAVAAEAPPEPTPAAKTLDSVELPAEPLTDTALDLAQILDDPDAIAEQITAARELTATMEKLRAAANEDIEEDVEEPVAQPKPTKKPGSSVKGCEQARIFTPPRRELTDETSDGGAAIAFAEQMLGMNLFPWQKWLLWHALELNPDYTYRFRTVIMSQSRQNGKTHLMVVLALWHLYCKGSRTIIATAQDLSKAEDAWAKAVEFAQDDEEMNELIRKISLAHPKLLRVLNPITEKICEYRVASKSRGGGRGYSGDLILLDELREHQNWDTWAATTKTTMARPSAQVWAFTNAGDALSVVWRYQRAAAHRELGWPDGDQDAAVLGDVDTDVGELFATLEKEMGGDLQVGWFEWSAPPNAKRTDRLAWAQANGSLNHTDIVEECITERAIAHALHTDPVSVFDQEVMCRFVALSDGGPFPEGSWRDTFVDEDTVMPKPGARSAVCVEVSTTRSASAIAIAALNGDGDPVVGIDEMLAGTDWVLEWLKNNRSRYSGIVVRSGAGSPVLPLIQEIEEAGLPIIEWKTAEVGAAFLQLYDRVVQRTIHHLPHQGLDSAASSASTKPQSAGGWIVDPLKSPSDTAPLYAVTGAVWGLAQLPDDRPSIYSGSGGAQVLSF